MNQFALLFFLTLRKYSEFCHYMYFSLVIMDYARSFLLLSPNSYKPKQNVCFYGEDLVSYLNLCLYHLYLSTIIYIPVFKIIKLQEVHNNLQKFIIHCILEPQWWRSGLERSPCKRKIGCSNTSQNRL